MSALLLTIVYLAVTIRTLLQVGDNESLLAFIALFLGMTALIGVLARATFQLRTEGEDWALLRQVHATKEPELSDTDKRKALFIKDQSFYSLYFSGLLAAAFFWRLLCEEPNPLDVFPQGELPVIVPALIPVFPFLLYEEWLTQATEIPGTNVSDDQAFWRICVQLLVFTLTILGPLQKETATEDQRMLTFICGLGIPVLVFVVSRLYRLYNSQNSTESSP